jgi:hypothetical protein
VRRLDVHRLRNTQPHLCGWCPIPIGRHHLRSIPLHIKCSSSQTRISTTTAVMSADFWSGYLSGAVGIIIGNPLDLIKTRMQAGSPKPAPTPTCTVPQPPPQLLRSHFENAGTLVRGALVPLPLYINFASTLLSHNAIV